MALRTYFLPSSICRFNFDASELMFPSSFYTGLYSIDQFEHNSTREDEKQSEQNKHSMQDGWRAQAET
ncbi:hypothetical protein PVAP13_2KG484505 [Panicum virgatum]|uniref:Uncharacterized protein n=1 Tax=Panicum virgatum TaxID=38727 RepID=A0A8T0WJ07_PANVG|nr:hypothetical protein PVAP13_2KG484505 [Panicum virgatum]